MKTEENETNNNTQIRKSIFQDCTIQDKEAAKYKRFKN